MPMAGGPRTGPASSALNRSGRSRGLSISPLQVRLQVESQSSDGRGRPESSATNLKTHEEKPRCDSSELQGSARQVLREQANGDRWAVRRDEGPDRRLLAVADEIKGGSDRMGEALSQSDRHGRRNRDSPGLRSGGLRGRVHSRVEGAGAAPSHAGGREEVITSNS